MMNTLTALSISTIADASFYTLSNISLEQHKSLLLIVMLLIVVDSVRSVDDAPICCIQMLLGIIRVK